MQAIRRGFRPAAVGISVFLFLMLLQSFRWPTRTSAEAPRRVLVIHSYHQEFPWTRLTDHAMRETLDASGLPIEYFTEYLDTKRYDPAVVYPEMERVCSRKFHGVRFDVVFVSDNDALEFVLSRRERLCPDVPIVFSGINRYRPEMLTGHRRVTGVAEETEMGRTVELALGFHPGARMVVGVSDGLTSAQLHMAQFKDVAARYQGRPEFVALEGLSTEELLDAIRRLPADAVVLHFSFFRGREGRQYSLRESVELITANSAAPVYTLWDWKVNWGVVGGQVSSGTHQGRLAAELILRILGGESADDIPVLRERTTVPMFDYPAMVRFGLTEDQLPAGSVVLHRPASLYREHSTFFLWGGVLFAVQLVIISGLVLSIFRRRSAEAALHESEAKYRSIFENAIEGIFRSTAEGRFVSVSPSFARMYGYESPEELIRSVQDIGTELYTEPQARERLIERLRESEVVSEFEQQVRRKDGSIGWVSVSARPVRARDGRLLYLEGFAVDITERKKAEDELRRQTVLFRNLFEGSPEAIAILDDQDRVLEVNRSFEKVFGYSELEARGREINDLVAPGPYREDARQVSDAVIRDGWIVEKEAVRCTKDGRPVDVSLIGYPIVVDGRQIGAYAIYRDITDRKRAEDALRSSLLEKESLLREVHHRVKNNLQVISSLLQLQTRKLQHPDVLGFVRDTQNRVRSMGLLHEALYRSGNLARISFPQYVKNVCAHVARSYAPGTGNIRLHCEIDEVTLDLDSAIPAGLIINELVSNAYKHAFPSGSEGEIRVELKIAPGGRLLLRVSDNGVGLGSEVDPEHSESLGLLLVRNLSSQLEGRYSVTSGRGTTFEIEFPAAPA